MSNKPISLNNGRFETATDGASITNIQAASVSSGTLATAQLPIVPTNKGGFGIDVSTGLTNGYVAVVSGGAITIGPPPSVSPSGSAGGDLSGTYPNPTVAKIQNVSVDATAPTLNQALIFDGTKWAPANVSTSPTGSAGGDLANTYPNPSVVKIQGVAVDTTAPTSGQVMEYDGTKWAPANLPTSLPPSGPAGGDLLNNYPNPSVVKIQGTSVSNIAPTADQFLRYNFVNARWEPTTVSSLPPSGSASGDLSGTYPSPSVVKLQGQTVSNTTPTINQFLRFDGSQWKPDTTAGIIPALTRILYVDLNSASLSPTGSIAEPYTTISAAISAARTATPLTTTGVRYEWVILVSPGSYDEDISFDGTSMHISIMGNGGPFNLGAYAAGTANYAPTNARNITWTITAGNLDSIRHSLRIGTLGIPAEGTTTHIGYNTVPRISGVVNVVDNMLGGTTKEVYLSCVIEDFSATGTCFSVSGTGAPTGVTMLYAHRARFKSAVIGTQLRLQQAFNSQFDGLVTIERHSGSNTSTFVTGLTLTSASTDIKPAGFINCDISGTFIGPANSLQCDGTTYTRFLSNGGVLAGGATLNLLEPIVPKNKGGFGQDVSTGLTNGHIAIVSGGAITIGPGTVVTDFTVNGTWTPDASAKRHTLMLVGGGGGGGSGRRGIAAMNFGGNGGEGGAYTEIEVLASEISGTFDVVVGTGGTGGAAVSTDDTDGNNGTGGNSSYIWKSGLSTFLAIAGGGRGGDGGTTAFPTQVYNGAIGTFNGGTGAVGGTVGNAPINADSIGRAAGGGGGGGGHDVLTDQAGSRGSLPVSRPGTQSTAGTAGGGNGTNGIAPFFPLGPGGGGGGGGSSVTTAGGSGGDGSNGGAGGGGGASLNGFNSGKGGDGGAGWVRVITYYN